MMRWNEFSPIYYGALRLEKLFEIGVQMCFLYQHKGLDNIQLLSVSPEMIHLFVFFFYFTF